MIGADEFARTADDGLRCVGGGEAHGVGVADLTLRPVGRGEGIAPAEPIPIIDVVDQRDDAATQLRVTGDVVDQRVGGRTARATLRSEELDDDRRRSELRRSAVHRQREHGNDGNGGNESD